MTKWTNFPRFFGLKRHATMDYHSLTKDTSMSATSANTSASAGRPASSSPGSTGAAGRRPGLFFTTPNHLPHQRVPQLQLPYPPTQHIRVIAQRLAIGSGLRHGIPPFRSPAPPFHRRGTVSSNDAPHRRRRQAPSPPASAAYQTGTIPPRDTASPDGMGGLGTASAYLGSSRSHRTRTLSGRIPQMLHHLLRGHRCGEIQLHRPFTLLATGHGNNPSAQSPRKRPQPLIEVFD